MRPWEYWQADAEEWTGAMSIHNAYHEGIGEARKAAEKAADQTRREAAAVEKLKQKGR